jgi:hypothetical protein
VSDVLPTQRAKLRSLVEAFDPAIDREHARWGASSAERMRAKGVALDDINAGGGRTLAERPNGGCTHG